MSDWLHTDPELQTVEDFVEYLMAEDLETFSGEELQLLNRNLRRPVHAIRTELEDYGLKIAQRLKPRRIRGVRTSSNDRWFGPGSSPCHGGSGYEQINGFAGQIG